MAHAEAGYRLGLLLVIASAAIWSTAGLFPRLISADAVPMLFWRGVFGAAGIAVLALLIYGREALRPLSPAAWAYAALSGIGMICFVLAFRYTSAAHVAVIYAAVPFIAGVAAWLVIGEGMTRRAIIAASAALVGVVMMVGFGNDGGLTGDLLALLMTLAMAAMMIVARRYRDIPMLPAAALSALLGAIAVVPFGDVLAVPSAQDWLLLFAFGAFNSALGLGLFTLGSQRLPPSETGLIGALDVPLAPLWIWVVFGDVPAVATFLGGGIVLAAVVWHLAGNLR